MANILRQQRRYARQENSLARLNRLIDYSKSTILHQSESSARVAFGLAQDHGLAFQNLHGAINDALAHVMTVDQSALLFGEDLASEESFTARKVFSINSARDAFSIRHYANRGLLASRSGVPPVV